MFENFSCGSPWDHGSFRRNPVTNGQVRRRNRTCRTCGGTWALLLLVGAFCLAGANPASAQAVSGILTGTIVDSSGAAVPGATVNATEASTGAVRTAVTGEAGLFRIPALNPGSYVVTVELASFKTLTVSDINLSTAETRDLGKLKIEVGGVTETLQVTSEVTPVQISDSARRKTVVGADLQNIQMKGRDIFGLLAVLPGVQDTNLNRDFSSWTSATQITINGAPSQNKDVRVDGINIVDEGGCGTAFVNLNMDAVNEVQVIANGYTAENGRNNGGLINVVTKSGTNTFKGVGLVQRPPRQVERERLFPQDQQPGEAAVRREHLRLQLRRSARDPEGVRQPEDGQEDVLLRVAGVHGRCAAERHGRGPTFRRHSSAPATSRRPASRTATFSRSSTRGPAQQFPNNIIPRGSHQPAGTGDAQPAADAQRDPESWRPASSGRRTRRTTDTPEHSRTNNVLRIDQTFTDKTRASVQAPEGSGRRVELQQLHAGNGPRQRTTRRASSRPRRSRRCSSRRSSTR